MKPLLSLLISLCGLTAIHAQNTAIDRYYQDRISSLINTGKALIEAKEIEEGLIYLKDAIKIASERSHDYIASATLINGNPFYIVIDHFYKIDSIALAQNYIDIHADIFMRYPNSLKRQGEITNEQYSDCVAACYSISANMAQNNDDSLYAIKYLELYADNAKRNNLISEEYFALSKNLVWDYLLDHRYLQALRFSIDLFNEMENAGKNDEESIEMARYSFNWVNRECRLDPTSLPTAREACDIWLSFVSPLYERKGEDYMDNLLMKLDQHDNWRDEIYYDMVSSTMIATLMSLSTLALEQEGYDAAKESLFDFKGFLYSKGKAELWPIACLNFLNILETQKLHSASYSFCKSIEQDYLSQDSLSQTDLLYYYIYYFGACDRVGDVGKCFDIFSSRFDSVIESDNMYWIVSRMKGSFFLKLGNYEKGLACMLSALDHYSFPSNPRKGDAILYAGLYSYVGQAYRRLGKTAEAIDYYQNAIALCDEYGIPDNKLHPYFDLGRIYHKIGEYDKARDYFLLCVDIQANTGAKYETSSPFSYLFDIERRAGNVERARQYLLATWQAHLSEYLAFRDYLTIQEQTAYWESEGDIGYLGGLVAGSSPIYNDIYYDMLLLSKGFLLKAEITEYNNVYESGDTRLERLYSLTHSGEGSNQKDIDDYMALYRSHYFNKELDISSWKTVQSMLSKNDLAIEFFKYEKDDINHASQYGALLLKKDWSFPRFIHLCSSAELERATRAQQRAYSVDGLLYGLIWEPLIKELRGVKNVYFSPHELLHTLNLSAILDSKGVPMFKSYNMYRLSSTQNIAAIKNPKINKAYVYGGLIYDSDEETMINEHRKYFHSERQTSGINWVIDTSFSRFGWSFLPSTETEIDNIAALLEDSNIDVVRYRGVEGTEESFKALSGSHPGVIHLATHGFYLQYSYSDSTAIADNHENKIAASRNALVRSGLILSNGGRAWKGDSIPYGVEDGILQADEIANLNLSGTTLLVLSACETALGDLSSDGVYGLQRAFKMSGVGTIIMSLWEVDDVATSIFMSYFYEAWTKGNNKHDAFVSAQNRLRQQYPEPYYWAAFIMLD